MNKWETLKAYLEDKAKYYRNLEYRDDGQSNRMITVEMILEDMEKLEKIEEEP
jgi:hypothetical protein